MLFVPIFLFVISLFVFWNPLKFDKSLFSKFAFKAGKIVCIQMVILSALLIILHFFAAGSNGLIPFIPVVIMCLPPYVLAVLEEKVKKEKLFKFLKVLSVAALVLFLVEVFFFNAKSFTTSWKIEEVPFNTINLEDNCEIQEEELIVKGHSVLTFNDIPEYGGAMIISMEQGHENNNPPFRVNLDMTDENHSVNYISVQEKLENGFYNHDCELTFNPYIKARSLKLTFNDVSQPITVSSIKISNKLPFSFETIRYVVCLLVFGLIVAIIEWKLYKVGYDSKKISHLIVVGITILMCVGMCSFFLRSGEKAYEYNPSDPGGDIYVKTLDAFLKGQLNLDMEPDPYLDSIENPYDPDARNQDYLPPYWDYSYYDGKFYSYFGVSPVVTYYYPYYAIHNMMPTMNMALYFYSSIATLFLCLAFCSAIRFFEQKPNLLLLVLSLFTMTTCSGIYQSMNDIKMYSVATVAGLCFLNISLWAGLTAFRTNSIKIRILLFVVSGLCFGLCMGSRPTIGLCVAVLVPVFVSILTDKKNKISSKILQAIGFCFPVMLVAAGLMWYNYARFGSPFDFGMTYQITVTNTSANNLRLSGIWGAFRHYFTMAPTSGKTFPFYFPQWGGTNNYSQYAFVYGGSIGWFNFAVVSLGMLVAPYVFENEKTQIRLGVNNLYRKLFLGLCLVVPYVIAWMDFCMGGATQRYLYDFAGILLIGCCITLIMFNRKLDKYKYVLTVIALVSSFIFMWGYTIGERSAAINCHIPALYGTLERLIIFWQ